jgi:hypothetical protein
MILTQTARLALKTSDESQRLAKAFEESMRWDAMAASVLASSVPLFILGIHYVVAWGADSVRLTGRGQGLKGGVWGSSCSGLGQPPISLGG